MNRNQDVDYCILRFRPSPVRGEFVNVGLILFLPERTDIKILRSHSKLKALVSGLDDDLLPGVRDELKEWTKGLVSIEERYRSIQNIPYFSCSPLGRFSVGDGASYTYQAARIFSELVEPMSELPARNDLQAKQFLKVRRKFHDLQVLSTDLNDINLGMVLSRFPLDNEGTILGDYAFKQKNCLHVIETIDLDQTDSQLKRTLGYKAFVFDYSKHVANERTQTYLLYNCSDKRALSRPLIRALLRYADDAVNTASEKEARDFFSFIKINATPNMQLPLQ